MNDAQLWMQADPPEAIHPAAFAAYVHARQRASLVLLSIVDSRWTIDLWWWRLQVGGEFIDLAPPSRRRSPPPFLIAQQAMDLRIEH